MAPHRSFHKQSVTLVEALLSVAILATTIVAITQTMLMAQKGSRLTRDRLIAANLTREGIEILYNLRDSNWIKFSSRKKECWLASNDDCSAFYISAPGTNYFKTVYDPNTLTLDLNQVTSGDPIAMDNPEYSLNLMEIGDTSNPSVESFQMYAGNVSGDTTKFSRKITITSADVNVSITVTSTVQWYDSSSLKQHVELQTILFNNAL